MTEPSSDGGDPSRVRRRQRLRGLILDVTPLREHRDYRLLWMGQGIGGIGTQITRLTLPFQVYALTGSPLAIAVLAAVQLVPILLFSLGAGTVVDAVDRRRVLLLTQAGLALGSVMLFGLALLPTPPLVAIYAVAFAMAGLSAVDQPARTSSTPRLVPPDRLPAALALNQVNNQTGAIVGPAIGGLLIASVGVAGAYLVDVVTYTVSITAVAALSPLPPIGQVVRPGIEAIREGLRFVASRRIILSTFAIDLNAMIFGMPTALFPVLALDVFRVGPEGLGFLTAAPAAGAFVGAFLSGWVSRVVHVGRSVILSVVVWGAAIVAFGLATFSFPLALAFLAIAGAADVMSAVFRNLTVQVETPDALRGRVTSIHVLSVTSGPRLGDIEAAAVAALIGAQLSVITGGLLCIVGTFVVARAFPELRDYRLRVKRAGDAVPAPAG